MTQYADTKWGRTKSWAKDKFGDLKKFFGTTPDGNSMEEYNGFNVPAKIMDSAKHNYDNMRPWREQAADGIAQFRGKYGVSKDEPHEPVPLNKIRQAVQIWMRLLASDTPQAYIQTDYADLKEFADTFELEINRHLKEVRVEDAANEAVLNAMFCVGVVKTAIAEGEPDDGFEADGVFYDFGKPFSSSVNLDNFVIDMEADSRHEISLIGDRFKRPRAWVDAMRKGDEESAAETLDASYMAPEERTSGITETPGKRLYEEVWCWDIYLPKQNLICLFVDNEDVPLDVYELRGPEGGPYELIGFDWVPGEVLPSAPITILEPLHNFINALMRKLENQARRQKSLTVYTKGNEGDATTIRDAADGATVGLTDTQSVGQIKMGGPEPMNHNMVVWSDEKYDAHAGNLPSLGGLEPQSETATQDKLLHESASALIDSMRRAVMKSLGRVIRAHAWYLWTNPLHNKTNMQTFPGTGFIIPAEFSEEVKEGDFLDYNFTVNPYSLKEVTPLEKANLLITNWERIILPNLQMFMQAGQMPNAVEMARQVFELQNIQMSELFTPMDPDQQQPQEPGQTPWPAQFKRSETHNVRESRPGTTQRGNNQSIMAANAGVQPQNDQAASLMRSQ